MKGESYYQKLIDKYKLPEETPYNQVEKLIDKIIIERHKEIHKQHIEK